MHLHTPVSARLPTGLTVTGEIWGKGHDKTAGRATFDVYEFDAHAWHSDLRAEDLTPLPGDPFAGRYRELTAGELAALDRKSGLLERDAA